MKVTIKKGRPYFFLIVWFTPFFFAAPFLQAQEVRTVIADGIGQDLDGAIQNSAENALIQVVGSFIDAETTVEKQVEIRGAVKEQSKNVSSRNSEYSQGSIKNIEVISSDTQGALVRVTSKVTVRLEEFQAYVSRTALAEATVQQGLFAKVQVQKEQSDNLGDIVIGRLMADIFNLEIVRLEVGVVDTISDPVLESEARKLLEPGPDDSLLSVTVSARLDPNYLTNAFDTLEKTAGTARKGSGIKSICNVPSDETFFWVFFGDLIGGEGRSPRGTPGANVFGSDKGGRACPGRLDLYKYSIGSPSDMRLYSFPAGKVNDLCAAADALLPRGANGYPIAPRLEYLTPAVSLKVLDGDQRAIVDTLLVDEDTNFRGSLVRSENAFVLGEWSRGSSVSLNSHGDVALQFLAYNQRQTRGARQCVFLATTESSFHIIMKLSSEQLSKAASIQVGLERL